MLPGVRRASSVATCVGEKWKHHRSDGVEMGSVILARNDSDVISDQPYREADQASDGESSTGNTNTRHRGARYGREKRIRI